jgi:hypothetical protein
MTWLISLLLRPIGPAPAAAPSASGSVRSARGTGGPPDDRTSLRHCHRQPAQLLGDPPRPTSSTNPVRFRRYASAPDVAQPAIGGGDNGLHCTAGRTPSADQVRIDGVVVYQQARPRLQPQPGQRPGRAAGQVGGGRPWPAAAASWSRPASRLNSLSARNSRNYRPPVDDLPPGVCGSELGLANAAARSPRIPPPAPARASLRDGKPSLEHRGTSCLGETRTSIPQHCPIKRLANRQGELPAIN